MSGLAGPQRALSRNHSPLNGGEVSNFEHATPFVLAIATGSSKRRGEREGERAEETHGEEQMSDNCRDLTG